MSDTKDKDETPSVDNGRFIPLAASAVVLSAAFDQKGKLAQLFLIAAFATFVAFASMHKGDRDATRRLSYPVTLALAGICLYMMRKKGSAVPELRWQVGFFACAAAFLSFSLYCEEAEVSRMAVHALTAVFISITFFFFRTYDYGSSKLRIFQLMAPMVTLAYFLSFNPTRVVPDTDADEGSG